jgi:phage shock protein PspC (stress-responsive transcriptional regulator)
MIPGKLPPAAAYGEELGGFMAATSSRLYRSSSDRIIAGVCGGIAEWLGWSPTMVRILYVVVSVLSVAFPGILVYLILWLVMPKA